MLVLFHSSSSSNSSSDFGFSCGGGGKQTEYENRFAEYEDEDELNIPGLLTGYSAIPGRRQKCGVRAILNEIFELATSTHNPPPCKGVWNHGDL